MAAADHRGADERDVEPVLDPAVRRGARADVDRHRHRGEGEERDDRRAGGETVEPVGEVHAVRGAGDDHEEEHVPAPVRAAPTCRRPGRTRRGRAAGGAAATPTADRDREQEQHLPAPESPSERRWRSLISRRGSRSRRRRASSPKIVSAGSVRTLVARNAIVAASTIRTPPIVGVPCLPSGARALPRGSCWPNSCRRRKAMNVGPARIAMISATSAATRTLAISRRVSPRRPRVPPSASPSRARRRPGGQLGERLGRLGRRRTAGLDAARRRRSRARARRRRRALDAEPRDRLADLAVVGGRARRRARPSRRAPRSAGARPRARRDARAPPASRPGSRCSSR